MSGNDPYGQQGGWRPEDQGPQQNPGQHPGSASSPHAAPGYGADPGQGNPPQYSNQQGYGTPSERGQEQFGGHQYGGHGFGDQGHAGQGYGMAGYGAGPGQPGGPGGPGGPGQPGGPGGPGQPGGPGGPGQPGGPGGPGESSGGPGKGLIFGIIGGVVGLIVIIAVVLFVVLGGGDDDAEAGDDETDNSENGDDTEVADGDDEDGGTDVAQGADATPDDAVEAYLTALSEGDAEGALALIDAPSDTSHMTDEVLEASLQIAPITDISVTEVGEVGEFSVSEEVTASFTVGEEEVTERFRVTTDDDGDSWAVDAAVSLTEPSAGSLDATVNGEEFSTSDAYVFFGAAYELDVSQENFSFGEDNIVYATESYISTSGLEVTLTEQATDEWRDVVVAAVEECVASNEREAGCGLDLPNEISGDEVVEGTVERSLPSSTEQDLDNLTPRPDWSNPNLVSAESFTGDVNVEYECRSGGQTGICELFMGDPGFLGNPVVDMAAEELEVEWE